jgi:hypothetical protein
MLGWTGMNLLLLAQMAGEVGWNER